MKLLLINDDGFDAPGLWALMDQLKEMHEVYVCAPDKGMSAMGHAISINKHMMVKEVFVEGVKKAYRIGGTPADCTRIALLYLFKDIPFDLVLSGINNGGNVGTEVIYSGTFAAAHEAHRFNYNAIAVSLKNPDRVDKPNFLPAARHFANFIAEISFGDKAFFYNVNYPHQKSEFILVQTSAAEVRYIEHPHIEKRGDLEWVALDGDPIDVSEHVNTDFKRLNEGYATLVNIDPDWSTFVMDQNTSKLIKL